MTNRRRIRPVPRFLGCGFFFYLLKVG
jgi:hypothetical protein